MNPPPAVPAGPPSPERPPRRRGRGPLRRLTLAGRALLVASRFLVVVAIACTLVGSATLLINAVWVTGHAVTHFIRLQPTDIDDVRHTLLELIEVVEVVLVAMVLYFITFGLYTLFLDRTLPVPRWMAAHSLDELTDKLFDIVGASLGVLFLAEVVEWDGERDLLRLGVGAAAVMLALAVSRLAGFAPSRGR